MNGDTFIQGFSWGAIVGAIVGALIGSVVTHFLTKERNKQERNVVDFNQAANEFKRAFIDELSLLRNEFRLVDELTGYTAYDILRKSLGKHETAKNKYYYFLPKDIKNDFESAWLDYLFPEAVNSLPQKPLIDYASEGDEPYRREIAIQKIEALLEFAKPR